MEFLRIHLVFYDALSEVVAVVQKPLSASGKSKSISGTIRGVADLGRFFEELGVDGYLVFSGDILRASFTATIHEASPDQIIEALDASFARVHDLDLRILSGDNVSTPKEYLSPPVSLTVCATKVALAEGYLRAEKWFQQQL